MRVPVSATTRPHNQQAVYCRELDRGIFLGKKLIFWKIYGLQRQKGAQEIKYQQSFPDMEGKNIAFFGPGVWAVMHDDELQGHLACCTWRRRRSEPWYQRATQSLPSCPSPRLRSVLWRRLGGKSRTRWVVNCHLVGKLCNQDNIGRLSFVIMSYSIPILFTYRTYLCTVCTCTVCCLNN